MINVEKIYVIHVRGQEERLNHMTKELARLGKDFELILEGNMSDLTPEILDKYFTGPFKKVSPEASCTLKHVYAYERMIACNVKQALIFEDDIILLKDFIPVFNASLREIEKEKLSRYLISYENTTFNVVPQKEVVKGKTLYKRRKTRCAGAYLLDLEAAKAIVDYTYKHKCKKVSDWHLNDLLNDEVFEIYWCHPPVVEQASHNGNMNSLIDRKSKGFLTKVRWWFKILWKVKLVNKYR